MSMNELESKCRELRQRQALIEEAQAEAEAIKDTLKAAMGDSESVQAKNHVESRDHRKNRHHGLEKGIPGGCTGIHQDHHNAALLRGISKGGKGNERNFGNRKTNY